MCSFTGRRREHARGQLAGRTGWLEPEELLNSLEGWEVGMGRWGNHSFHRVTTVQCHDDDCSGALRMLKGAHSSAHSPVLTTSIQPHTSLSDIVHRMYRKMNEQSVGSVPIRLRREMPCRKGNGLNGSLATTWPSNLQE